MKNKIGKSVLKQRPINLATIKIDFRKMFAPYKQWHYGKMTGYRVPVTVWNPELIPEKMESHWSTLYSKILLYPNSADVAHPALASHSFICVPDKGYYVYPKMDLADFFERYSLAHKFTKKIHPYKEWKPFAPTILPDRFRGLLISPIFRNLIRAREKDALKLSPDEFVALNEALQFKNIRKEILSDAATYKYLDLKDPKGCAVIIKGLNKVM